MFPLQAVLAFCSMPDLFSVVLELYPICHASANVMLRLGIAVVDQAR